MRDDTKMDNSYFETEVRESHSVYEHEPMNTIANVVVMIACLLTLSGCSVGKVDRAEKFLNQIVAETNQMATSIEAGDLATFRRCTIRLAYYETEGKAISLNERENEELKKRIGDKINVSKDMLSEALKKARTSGKFTPAELLEISKFNFQ
jgi:hypothetical protein